MQSWSVCCDRTGFIASASECVTEWTGLFVIAEYAEQRNAQEFLQIPRDDIAVPIARPCQPIDDSDPGYTLQPDPTETGHIFTPEFPEEGA